MLDRRWPRRIRGGGQGRERPGLAAVVTAAHADRAARSAVGRGPVSGHRDVEAAGLGVHIDAMQPHRVGTDVSGGARCAQPAEREAGLLDGRRDPGRTDVERLRLRVEIHLSDDHGESSDVGRRRPSKGSASDPIGEGRPGTTRRTRRRRGPVEADTRSATSRGSRAASGPGRSPSSSTSRRSPRTPAGGTRAPRPAGEPVVADVDRPVVGAGRVAVHGDLRKPADPRRRAPFDAELRPRGAFIVAERRRQAEAVIAAARDRHVRPVEAALAIRTRSPRDRGVEARATARTPRRAPLGRPPGPAAVMRDADGGVEAAGGARSAVLVHDGEALGVRRVGRHDRLPGTVVDRLRDVADGRLVDDGHLEVAGRDRFDGEAGSIGRRGRGRRRGRRARGRRSRRGGGHGRQSSGSGTMRRRRVGRRYRRRRGVSSRPRSAPARGHSRGPRASTGRRRRS